jgi:hypothetical protein
VHHLTPHLHALTASFDDDANCARAITRNGRRRRESLLGPTGATARGDGREGKLCGGVEGVLDRDETVGRDPVDRQQDVTDLRWAMMPCVFGNACSVRVRFVSGMSGLGGRVVDGGSGSPPSG